MQQNKLNKIAYSYFKDVVLNTLHVRMRIRLTPRNNQITFFFFLFIQLIIIKKITKKSHSSF